MIGWLAALPGWLLGHPWGAAGLLVGLMALTLLPLALNPKGRQVREILRRKK